MSPSELAEELQVYLLDTAEEDYDDNLIQAYLDILNEKAPIEVPDVEKAYERFQAKLRSLTPEEASKSPAPAAAQSVPNASTDNQGRVAKKTGFLFQVRRVAAAFMIALGCLSLTAVGAQACGVDVFGRLAQWTDEQFWFLPSSGSGDSTDYTQEFQQALEEHELPKSLAPAWYPKGFESGEINSWEDDLGIAVEQQFLSKDNSKFFAITIEKYTDPNSTNILLEKDSNAVRMYTSGNRTFYVFSNIDDVVAIWSSDEAVVRISGDLSVGDIEKIIDSIGGL